MQFMILGVALVLVPAGRSQPGLHEWADFYTIRPDVSGKLRTPSGVIFLLARRPLPSGAAVSLELIDESNVRRGVQARVIAGASTPYWDPVLESFGTQLNVPITTSHMDRQLRGGLIALAGAVDLDAVDLSIIEQLGGPADSFIVVTAPHPNPAAGPAGRLAGIGIPASPADNVLVVDPALTQGTADVVGYTERIARHKRNGYQVIGLGSEGIAFRKGTTYLFETYQSGAWAATHTTTTRVDADPPAWVDGLGPRRAFVAGLTPETRRDVHAALAVCSESSWRGLYGYASDPAVWAVH